MGRRGPYAKGRERRDAILRTALAVFSQSGYHSSSLRQIASTVGISPTLLQHHFPTRENLLTELVSAWDRENEAAAGELPVFDRWMRQFQRNLLVPGLVHLYTAYAVEASDPQHPARPFFLERYDRFSAELAADIRSRQRAGKIDSSSDAEQVARALIAACEGLQIRWLYDRSFDMLGEFLEILARYQIYPNVTEEMELSVDAAAVTPG